MKMHLSIFLLMQSCFYQIIEPLVSKQWFVTMDSLAEKALHAVEKGELTILPERFEKVCNTSYIFLCSSFIYLAFTMSTVSFEAIDFIDAA